MTTITKTKLKGRYDRQVTVYATLTTPADVIEYCITQQFLKADQWKGWYPETLQNVQTFLELDTVSSKDADLMMRFNILNPNRTARPNNVEFYIRRGYSTIEATAQVSQLQKSRNSIKQLEMSPEYWVSKGYSPEEAQSTADDKRNGSTIRRPEYWMKRGYSIEDAQKKVSDVQKSVSPKSTKSWIDKGLPEDDAVKAVSAVQTYAASKLREAWKLGTIDPACSVRRIEYWLKKHDGDAAEAAKSLSKWQTTFSLQICIEKYGEEKGTAIWVQRQAAWQHSLRDRSAEELDQIRMSKGSGSGRLGGYGLLSQSMFWDIHERLTNQQFEYAYYFAQLHPDTLTKSLVGNYEYIIITPKSVIKPDFYIPELNLIIEFDEKHHWQTTKFKNADVVRTQLLVEHLVDPTIIRVRETEYKADPKKTVERLVQAVERAAGCHKAFSTQFQ